MPKPHGVHCSDNGDMFCRQNHGGSVERCMSVHDIWATAGADRNALQGDGELRGGVGADKIHILMYPSVIASFALQLALLLI